MRCHRSADIIEVNHRWQMNGLLGGYSREITRVLDCSAICWIVQCVGWLGLAHVNYPFHMLANCCSALDGSHQIKEGYHGAYNDHRYWCQQEFCWRVCDFRPGRGHAGDQNFLWYRRFTALFETAWPAYRWAAPMHYCCNGVNSTLSQNPGSVSTPLRYWCCGHQSAPIREHEKPGDQKNKEWPHCWIRAFLGSAKFFQVCERSLPWPFSPAFRGQRKYAAQTASILKKPLRLRLEEAQNPSMLWRKQTICLI